MKTVHTSGTANKSKYATAVYAIELPEYINSQRVDEEWVIGLFKNTYGKSSTPFYLTYTDHKVRWLQLISNTTQTTRKDVIRRISEVTGWDATDPRIVVTVQASVPFHGQHDCPGTPRLGTKQVIKRAAHGKGVTAR